MNMGNHTPGPWKYEPGTKTIRSQKENYWLASMNSWDGAVNHEANARLIAAAPDLLEACRWLVDYAPTPSDAAKARAAIDKAEG
jgi:hypothetical protein